MVTRGSIACPTSEQFVVNESLCLIDMRLNETNSRRGSSIVHENIIIYENPPLEQVI